MKHQAQIEVDFREIKHAALDAQDFDLTAEQLPGSQLLLSGEYEDLMKFLTTYFHMSGAEADIEIVAPLKESTQEQEHLARSEFSFDRFMDATLLAEHKSARKVSEDTSQRIRARRNQEHPLGRMRVVKR